MAKSNANQNPHHHNGIPRLNPPLKIIKPGKIEEYNPAQATQILKQLTPRELHMDYVHINPVKQGLLERVKDWPYSTFHKLVEQGIYAQDWGGGFERSLEYED